MNLLPAPGDVVEGVQLLSVNVAMPSYLGAHRGRSVTSGFRKRPVRGDTVAVGLTGIEGDGQADLSVHGGPDKAVYAYSRDRDRQWIAAEPSLGSFGPAYFGENLTVSGWTESDVRIGGVWSWGDVQLQVCQPRWPCFKLSLASGRPELGRLMLQHGWTGWYFRVLVSGEAPVRGPVRVTNRGVTSLTVLDAHAANVPGADPALIERVLTEPALAANWRKSLVKNQNSSR